MFVNLHWFARYRRRPLFWAARRVRVLVASRFVKVTVMAKRRALVTVEPAKGPQGSQS
jgi:hypothetical protein